MYECEKCGHRFVLPVMGQAANDNAGIVYVKNNHALLRPANIQRLSQSLSTLPIPSRGIVDWLADTLFIQFDGIYLWPNGNVFEINDEDIDRIFGHETATRWLRALRARSCEPFTQAAASKLADRYRLLDAAFQAETLILKNNPSSSTHPPK